MKMVLLARDNHSTNPSGAIAELALALSGMPRTSMRIARDAIAGFIGGVITETVLRADFAVALPL